MQAILGAGGLIGKELARVLPSYTDRVRLVSRNPKKVVASNELVAADLMDPEGMAKAVAGSDVVYLVVGFPYKTAVWREAWPVVMRNALSACKAHGSKLVFFDNIYMYDRDYLGDMDEATPIRPTSGKGAVRAEVARMLLDAIERGEVDALIARSADFYGPGKQANSVLTQTVFERIAAGKRAQWLRSADHPHSFTYTPDAARATALLGNTADAYGTVWHLPTAPNPMTGREWVAAIARELGGPAEVQVARSWMMTVMGWFAPTMREVKEMAYQYDRPYVFRSDKYTQRFGMEATSYADGIRAIVDADYR